jgi:hypothetical protein
MVLKLLLSFFRILISTTPAVVSTVGVLPVARALWNIRSFIRQGHSDLINLHVVFPHLNTYVINTLIKPITPYFKDCLKVPGLFKRFFNYYLLLISFSLFKPLILKLFRWSTGLILTSIGILWNDSLQGI